MRGELDHQAFGQRLDGVAVILLGLGRLRADGDGGAASRPVQQDGVSVAPSGSAASSSTRLHRFVLGAHISAIDD